MYIQTCNKYNCVPTYLKSIDLREKVTAITFHFILYFFSSFTTKLTFDKYDCCVLDKYATQKSYILPF